METKIFSITLQQKKALTPEILELRFSKPEAFEYWAGQFVQFHIREKNKIILRSYSISSCPSDPYLEFCVKLVPAGKGSGLFSGLEIGMTATMQGPSGRFTIDGSVSELVFIATGVGLAPIMSMLRDEKSSREIYLLFGTRTEQDLFWLDRIESIHKKNPRFSHLITLSGSSGDWTGARGRVTEHLDGLPKEAVYYLCGNVEMVKDVRSKLLANGVSAQRIRFEVF